MAPSDPHRMNPLIPGFAPDPTITRIGDTFFLAVSSFHLFPGIPIFASRNLASWEQIGNAINRPSQLSLRDSLVKVMPNDNPGERNILAAGGLYAPTLRHHGGITYLVCTNVLHYKSGDYDLKNFIVSTSDIWSGEWTDPIYFDFFGIDPSLFWDDQGRTFIHGSWWIDRPVHDRVTISCQEIDIKTGKTIAPTKVVWEGFSKEAPEGPHVYQKDGWYYLLIAEGGTGQGHHINALPGLVISGVLLNPAHTTRFFQLHPKTGQYNTLDPETFSKTYRGNGGCFAWVSERMSKAASTWAERRSSQRKPYLDYVHIRDPDLGAFAISPATDCIRIIPGQNGLNHSTGPISFIGRWQRAIDGTSTARLLVPNSVRGRCESGLALYKDEHRYVRIFWDSGLNAVVFEMYDDANSVHITSCSAALPETTEVLFKAQYSAARLEFSDATNSDTEYRVLGSVDTLDVSDYNFTGPVFGIFSLSNDGGSTPHDFTAFQVDN